MVIAMIYIDEKRCLGHYLCYHKCACHEPHTAVVHVNWTWTRLTCGTDLLSSSLVSSCFVLALLDYVKLVSMGCWVARGTQSCTTDNTQCTLTKEQDLMHHINMRTIDNS